MTTQTKPTCQEQVPQYPGSYLYRDCGVTASLHEADPARTEGGKLKWYCRRHAPSIVAAKNVTRNAAWDAKWAAERAEAEAKQRQQAEDCRKLAAFDDVLKTAMAYARAVTEHCDHQYEVAPELAALLAAIKKARIT